MSEDLCIPSRANTLTGNYSAEYTSRKLAEYTRLAEPRSAIESPIEKYFRPIAVVEIPLPSATVRKVCASVKMGWTVNRPQPAPILAVGWPTGVKVVVE